MKTLYRMVIAVILLFSISESYGVAATIHVPSQYTTIQSAIDVSMAGDTVLVAPGVYVENLDFKGKAITVMSSDGPEATIIDGSKPIDPDFNSVVMFRSGEGPSTLLTGFTLTNGGGTLTDLPNPHKYTDVVGGGIFCLGSSPRLINNILTQNFAEYGGAICCVQDADPLIQDNLVLENRGGFGAGITCIDSSEPTIIGNTVHLSTNSYTGGGFYIWDSAPRVLNNLITENTSAYGGGMACISASPLVMNNIFLENGSGYGGAVYCGFDSSPRIINNTFHDNQSNYGKALCSWRSSASVLNSIFSESDASFGPQILIGTTSYPSTFSIAHSNLQGGHAALQVEPGCTLHWGDGMISADPLFVDAANGDLHLTFNSPCRGSGDYRIPKVDHDFEGDPRMAYGAVDMGADEFYPHLYLTGDRSPGGDIEIKLCGLPGTTKNRLYFGSGVLPRPQSTPWGLFYLVAPWDFVWLSPIPSTGVMVLPAQVPPSPGAPYDLPMQAVVGDQLTNLFELEVRE